MRVTLCDQNNGDVLLWWSSDIQDVVCEMMLGAIFFLNIKHPVLDYIPTL